MTSFCMAGFGEIMLRLSPPGKKRLLQALPGPLEATFAGAEINVCADAAALGARTRVLTALPETPVSRAFAAQLAGMGCDVSAIHYAPAGRLGIFYSEPGSNMRPGNVIYDREGSAMALLPPEAYDFRTMLRGVTLLHLSGITPALSRNACDSTLALAAEAVKAGITLSVDLNYRGKLWNWEPGTEKKVLANRCMTGLVRSADIIIGSEGEIDSCFGISSGRPLMRSGKLDLDGCRKIVSGLSRKFPKAGFIAVPLVENISSDSCLWGGLLCDARTGNLFCAPLGGDGRFAPWEIRDIVDRFGAGDSFSAGLLYALHAEGLSSPETAVRFAAAEGALKYTIPGDYNVSSRTEVEHFMTGAAGGGIAR